MSDDDGNRADATEEGRDGVTENDRDSVPEESLNDAPEESGLEDASEESGRDNAPSDADLPAGWTVWNDEPGGRRILAYRPDVFDADEFPAACLPTLYVAAGQPNRPAAEAEYGTTTVWRVEFFLEPEVEAVPARTYDTREEALAGARDLAEEFASGELDYRGAYQVPRDEYLDELDELTGRDGE